MRDFYWISMNIFDFKMQMYIWFDKFDRIGAHLGFYYLFLITSAVNIANLLTSPLPHRLEVLGVRSDPWESWGVGPGKITDVHPFLN